MKWISKTVIKYVSTPFSISILFVCRSDNWCIYMSRKHLCYELHCRAKAKLSQALKFRKSTENRCLISKMTQNGASAIAPPFRWLCMACDWRTNIHGDNTVYHRNTRFINTKQFIKQQCERVVDKTPNMNNDLPVTGCHAML